jgi:hypothetical protein
MKKIYLMALTAAFAMSVNAQTTIKIKNPIRGEKKENLNAKVSSPMQVAASIVCNTQYVAGSTMDLQFTYTASNADLEFVDLLTLTFPAGITPNSSPDATFPTSNTGGGAEALNAPVGQVISWGVDNNDGYGGIISTATGVNFTVNVTVAAGTAGNQTLTFDASGDGYGATPGDLTGGACVIYPAGAALVDIKTIFVQPFNLSSLSNCNYGLDTLVAQITNIGSTTESNINVSYSVNGGTAMMTVVPGPLAPGDSTFVFWLPAYDFSATNTYDLKAWVAQASDVNLANDTTTLSFSNNVSIPLTSSSYVNGIETAANVADISVQGTAANFTGLSTGTFHSGLQALFTTVAATNPAGTYSMIVSLPCMDVVNGETYRISYWRRTNATAGGNGMSGLVTGTSVSALTTVLKPLSSITPLTTWLKDSVDYVATTTETRYFGISASGTVAAATQMNVRLDDINITKVTSGVGIKTISNNNTISIFPNPTSGILNVTSTEASSSIEVINVIGEKVYSNTLVKGNNSIDLSGLSNGAYFVKINSNNQITTKKVVLSK